MEKEVVKLKLKHHHHNPHNNNTNNSSTKTSLRERNIIGEGSDFVLNWGSMKRPRCMKIQVKNHSTPVVRSHNNTTVGNVNRTTNGFNLRQRSAVPAQPPSRILRNSEGGSGMKTHHTNYQTNGVGGMKGLASPEREKKSGGAQQYHHNDNHENNMIINGGGKTTSSETKGGESLSGGGTDVVWPPKFMISLTNKEKEEDFMAIKGSKLPQRPKKRAKFIQRTINLVSPGGWLCDLTLERYEVREKKITKKRPRGLKDMGNYVESDSD